MVDNAGGAVFDASQYEFFGGNDAVEEVELGGLEDEEDDVAPAGFEEEEFIFDGEQVASSILSAYNHVITFPQPAVCGVWVGLN